MIPDSIFPKDPFGNLLCPKCRSKLDLCSCPSMECSEPAPSLLLKPRIRLEKTGRNGKKVTLVETLPCDEIRLEELSRQLKKNTGSGGTFYLKEGFGIIEVQGDHRKILEKYFNQE